MADSKNIQVNIKGSATSLQQASKKAKASLGGVDKAAGKMGAALAGAFGAAIIIRGIGQAIAKIAEFENTMRRVAIISKGSEEALSKLARTLGETTVFTANQAGEAMTFLAQAGFNANEILAATPGVLELAAAAQLDLGRAADIASNILSAYGLEVKELNRVNDILVVTTNNSNTSVSQFAEAFKLVGPIAKAAGVSINEVSSLIGVLGDAGIQGSLAGTQLKTAISTLINPSEKAAKVLRNLGVETKNADGTMRGLTDIFADLRDANISAEQAFQIFEQRAAAGALVMAGAAEKAAILAEKTEEVGAAAEQSTGQIDTLKGDITKLGSAWEGLILKGGALNNTIRAVVTGFTEFTSGLGDVITGTLKVRDPMAAYQAEMFRLGDAAFALRIQQNKINEGLDMTDEKLREYVETLKLSEENTESVAALTQELTNRLLELTAAQKEAIAALQVEKLRDFMVASEEFALQLIVQDGLEKDIISTTDELIARYGLLGGEIGKVAADQDELIKAMDKTTAAAAKERIALDGLKGSAFAAGAATAALAIANRSSAKEIIQAALAVTIAKAIEGAAFLGPIAGPIVAGIAIAAFKALFSSLPEFARGTSFAPGGAALVGERGPEVVSLPRGARVTPNNLLSGGGGVSIVVNGFVGDEYQLATIVQEAIANQGSNVDRTSFV